MLYRKVLPSTTLFSNPNVQQSYNLTEVMHANDDYDGDDDDDDDDDNDGRTLLTKAYRSVGPATTMPR